MPETTPRKTADALRSARWIAPDDLRSFGHRSRLKQMGYGEADYVGKPVIAILNTWNDLSQCHTHFPERVEQIKRGILQAGGFPVEIPVMSLSEMFMKPSARQMCFGSLCRLTFWSIIYFQTADHGPLLQLLIPRLSESQAARAAPP